MRFTGGSREEPSGQGTSHLANEMASYSEESRASSLSASLPIIAKKGMFHRDVTGPGRHIKGRGTDCSLLVFYPHSPLGPLVSCSHREHREKDAKGRVRERTTRYTVT